MERKSEIQSHRGWIQKFLCGACLLLFLFSTMQAQAQGNKQGSPVPTPDEEEIHPDDVISVSTSEVLLPVTVRDAGGKLVTTLTRENFRVFEDGREQPLSDLALRQVPVDVVLMVDASSSAAANLDDFRRAVEGFVSNL